MERDPDDLAQILVSRCPTGAGIGSHRDAPAFGSKIAGVSLLALTRVRLQRTIQGERRVADLEPAPRSAYLLTGSARWSWQHSILAAKALRHSITFRTSRLPVTPFAGLGPTPAVASGSVGSRSSLQASSGTSGAAATRLGDPLGLRLGIE